MESVPVAANMARSRAERNQETRPGEETGPTPRLRFVAEGGIRERVRASLAAPFLGVASAALTAAALTGRRGAVHTIERAAGRLAERLAKVRVEATGLGAVDPDEQYVVVSLHEGLADVLALLHLQLPLRFAARDELFAWPHMGRYLRASRQVQVDSAFSVGAARRIYRDAEQVFADGDSLVVFAQGSILGVEVGFRPGAVQIARRFDRPVLPVVLTGSHRVWEYPFAPTLRFGRRISMQVLKPIAAVDLDDGSSRVLERAMKNQALRPEMAPARRYQPEKDGWWDGYDFEIDVRFGDLRARLAAHRGSPETDE